MEFWVHQADWPALRQHPDAAAVTVPPALDVGVSFYLHCWQRYSERIQVEGRKKIQNHKGKAQAYQVKQVLLAPDKLSGMQSL